ncbi:MAG: hypothetical protein IPN53_09405 [Comamonadaceae bacterium]|nr:hypothetical protein [Comamonadaceae bacterium]
MNATALIANHMNAPFGELLCAQDLADSLRVGRLSAKSGQASAALGYLFVETDPRLIASCAFEVGTSLANASLLYLDTLDHQAPRSPQWEQAVAGQL